MRKVVMVIGAVPLLAGGCVAKTAWNVATLPVKATGKAVDWTTTSQSEADRNYGRKMRKQEEKEGRERKKADRACRDNPDTCQPYDNRADRADRGD